MAYERVAPGSMTADELLGLLNDLKG